MSAVTLNSSIIGFPQRLRAGEPVYPTGFHSEDLLFISGNAPHLLLSGLAVGSEGQVLSVASGALSWQDPLGSGGFTNQIIDADFGVAVLTSTGLNGTIRNYASFTYDDHLFWINSGIGNYLSYDKDSGLLSVVGVDNTIGGTFMTDNGDALQLYTSGVGTPLFASSSNATSTIAAFCNTSYIFIGSDPNNAVLATFDVAFQLQFLLGSNGEVYIGLGRTANSSKLYGRPITVIAQGVDDAANVTLTDPTNLLDFSIPAFAIPDKDDELCIEAILELTRNANNKQFTISVDSNLIYDSGLSSLAGSYVLTIRIINSDGINGARIHVIGHSNDMTTAPPIVQTSDFGIAINGGFSVQISGTGDADSDVILKSYKILSKPSAKTLPAWS